MVPRSLVRAVVQRVLSASVEVDGTTVGAVNRGLLAYVAAGKGDTETDADFLAEKVSGLRIFGDATGKMTDDVTAVGGGVLAIPQFTLFGDVRRGRRPSFDDAEEPMQASLLFDRVVESLRTRVPAVAQGRFRAEMRIHSIGDGPVTILIDTRRVF